MEAARRVVEAVAVVEAAGKLSFYRFKGYNGAYVRYPLYPRKSSVCAR
jgi:hypothetical protein